MSKLPIFGVLLIGLGLASGEADAAGFYISGVSIGTPISSGSPVSASYGSTIGPNAFSFPITTTDGDTYSIAGNVTIGYGAAGSLFMVNMTATYSGTTPSAGTDSFTVDVYDNIYDPGPGSWAGTYTNRSGYTVAAGLGTGSTFNEDLLWNGASVGEIGPYTTPGFHSSSVSKALSFGAGNTTDTLHGDYRFNFTFGGATASGASVSAGPSINVSTTPEPREALPLLGLMLAGMVWMRVRGQRSLISYKGKNL